MINWAIRYQPISKELAGYPTRTVLEVGSGPEGLAMFWRGQVTGIDSIFKRRPMHRAAQASTLALPFSDRSWSIVVSCDMLEHIQPAARRSAVKEMSRVCDQVLLLAFPSGAAAQECYAQLVRRCSAMRVPWLLEHVEYGLPDAAEVSEWLQAEGWSVRTSWHESVAAHQRLMTFETLRPIQAITYALTRIAGAWLARHLPVSNDAPQLRAVLRAERI